MIKNKFKLNVTNDQIRRLRDKHLESLLNGASDSPFGTSAEKLIAYFSSLTDTSFVCLTHHHSSGFVTHVKTRGKSADTISAFDVGISKEEIETWRNELLLNTENDQQPKILVSLCWTLDSELLEYTLFPEFLAIDVTFGTNRNSRNVAKVVGIDSSNKIVTFASCFIGSKQRKAYRWLFEVALPSLLGPENVKMTNVVAMDNEEMMNQAWLSADCWKNSILRLDYYHIFLKPWKFNIPRTTSKSVNDVMNCVYKWISTFFDYTETEQEYNLSKNLLRNYLKDQSMVLGSKFDEFVQEILEPIFAKERFITHFSFMGATYFNFKGDSIVEAENAVHKKYALGISTLTKCAEKQINLSENRQQRHLM